MTTFSRLATRGVCLAVLAVLTVGCGSDESPGADSIESLAPPPPTKAPITSPPTSPAPTAPPTTTSEPTRYVVQAGDSLYGIAKKHCVKIDLLLFANGFPEGIDHVLQPGDKIVIPPTACRDGGAGGLEPAGTAPTKTTPPTTTA